MHVQVHRGGVRAGQAVAGSRVGILGGIFNPPHVGHLVLAQEAVVQLGLEAVVIIPAGVPPHREVEEDPGPAVRLRMCELAVEGDERLSVSRFEIEREGPAYTVETLRELVARAPDVEHVLLLGGDQAAALREWRAPEEVLSLAAVAAVEREELGREEIGAALAGLRGAERIEFFTMPRIDVSSSLVRARVAAGLPVRYLVPDRVAALIAERSLYRAPAAVGSP